MVAADSRTAIAFSLSAGNDHDAPHGRALLEEDRAFQLMVAVGFRAVEAGSTVSAVELPEGGRADSGESRPRHAGPVGQDTF
jgi:hypothetical protein